MIKKKRKPYTREHIYEFGKLTKRGEIVYAVAEMIDQIERREFSLMGGLIKTTNSREIAVEAVELIEGALRAGQI